MAARIVNLPTPEQLRELLRYEPDTGRFFWKAVPGLGLSWNAKYSGKEALVTIRSDGYLKGKIRGVNVLSHRAAWAIYYGEWPGKHIDHINGRREDNRISNIRCATNSENMRNTGVRSNNTSGLKGVSWDASCNKWQANIKIHGSQKNLGRFDELEAAHAAYCEAAKKYHGDFARTE